MCACEGTLSADYRELIAYITCGAMVFMCYCKMEEEVSLNLCCSLGNAFTIPEVSGDAMPVEELGLGPLNISLKGTC